jgi:hypothetical protein
VPQASQSYGDECVEPWECENMMCIMKRGERRSGWFRGVCSQLCSDGNRCPAGFSCEQLYTGEKGCIPKQE